MIERWPISIKLNENDKSVVRAAKYINICHCPRSLSQRKQELKYNGTTNVKITVPIKCQDFLLPSFWDKNGILTLSIKNALITEAAAMQINWYSTNQPALAAESPNTCIRTTKRNELSNWRTMSFITWPTPQAKRWKAGVRDCESDSIYRQHSFDILMFFITCQINLMSVLIYAGIVIWIMCKDCKF